MGIDGDGGSRRSDQSIDIVSGPGFSLEGVEQEGGCPVSTFKKVNGGAKRRIAGELGGLPRLGCGLLSVGKWAAAEGEGLERWDDGKARGEIMSASGERNVDVAVSRAGFVWLGVAIGRVCEMVQLSGIGLNGVGRKAGPGGHGGGVSGCVLSMLMLVRATLPCSTLSYGLPVYQAYDVDVMVRVRGYCTHPRAFLTSLMQ